MIISMKEHRPGAVLLIEIMIVLAIGIMLNPIQANASLNLGSIEYPYGTNPPPTIMKEQAGEIIDATSTQAIAPIATDAPSIQIENPVAATAPEYTDQQKQLIELIKELTALLAQLIALRAQK